LAAVGLADLMFNRPYQNRPDADVLTIERKTAKHHKNDAAKKSIVYGRVWLVRRDTT
jgi:hypothetical protein